MDLLQGVQDHIQQDNDVPKDITEESSDAKLEKLLGLIEKLNLTDANEEQLRNTLIKKAEMGLLNGFMPDAMKKLNISEEPSPYLFIYLLALISFILIILVFFGYKLYKSHADRERKREEKRRLKQQKKKK
ncbi:hypothetical protein WA026_015169 [Henosepilachna vigintioctopunctata]|uniref:Type VII secretion protein EssA n=1 Tax=Henosepilachna vigintioctopunctata TaxID=420089 RepID=A0AAW1TV01_9CUCU